MVHPWNLNYIFYSEFSLNIFILWNYWLFMDQESPCWVFVQFSIQYCLLSFPQCPANYFTFCAFRPTLKSWIILFSYHLQASSSKSCVKCFPHILRVLLPITEYGFPRPWMIRTWKVETDAGHSSPSTPFSQIRANLIFHQSTFLPFFHNGWFPE